MHQSDAKHISNFRVFAPKFQGIRIHMLPIVLGEPLPESVNQYDSLVKQIADSTGYTGNHAFLMVDESFVPAGQHHRRPGIHVEGHWNISAHGPQPGRHRPTPEPLHRPPRHSGVGAVCEQVLMWSNTGGTAFYKGRYTRDFATDWRGGDCSDVDVSKMDRITSGPYELWETDVVGLHETTPMPINSHRQFLRINIPLH